MASSFGHLLAAKKLRQVEKKEASEAPRPQICETTEDYHRLMDDAKFEEYWAVIERFSFASRFFPLTVEMAKELQRGHSQWKSAGDLTASLAVNWQDYPALSEAVAAMQRFYEQESGWAALFLRLSTRSPKDAALSRPGIAARLREEYLRLRAVEASDAHASPASSLLHALYRVSTELMRSTSAAEAVQLLLESPRIQDDLTTFIASPDPTPFNFVLREFAAFEPENEFRAFSFGRRLTAVTQYNEYCYFPALPARVEGTFRTLIPHILEEQLLPLLPATLSNAVIDIIMIEASDASWQLRIVEINPFAEFASSGLFSWEKDWQVLQGKKPFEFRYATTPPAGSDRLDLPPAWKQVVLNANIDL